MDYGKILSNIGKVLTSKKAIKIYKDTAEGIGVLIAAKGTEKIVDKILSHEHKITLSERLNELDKLRDNNKLTMQEYDIIRKKVIELHS